MSNYRNLARYFKDHLAGAGVALELLELLARENAGKPAGKLAAELLVEVREDVEVLETLLEGVAPSRGRLARLLGSLAGLVGRLKLARKYSGVLGNFEAWEVLSLGILGKRALWHALREIEFPGRPSEEELVRLAERAERQFARVEAMRLEFARQSLQS